MGRPRADDLNSNGPGPDWGSAYAGCVSRRVHILAIEISNPGAGVRAGFSGPSVALGAMDALGNAELIDREWLRETPANTRGGIDDDLMPALERMFVRVGQPAREMLRGEAGRVAVSVGPGGYTSLRIACAAGKMVALGAGCACIAVPTEVALARAARRDAPAGPIAVALASKGPSAWARVLDAQSAGDAGRVVGAEAVDAWAKRGVRLLVADAHLPREMRAVGEAAGVRVIEPVFDAAEVMVAAASIAPCDPVAMNPVYAREPDAVTQWRARKGPLGGARV